MDNIEREPIRYLDVLEELYDVTGGERSASLEEIYRNYTDYPNEKEMHLFRVHLYKSSRKRSALVKIEKDPNNYRCRLYSLTRSGIARVEWFLANRSQSE